MQPSVFDHPIVGGRYFFPRPDAPARTRIVAVDGAELACAEHRVHPDGPVLVHFHGNGETVADYVPDIAALFADVGINTFFAEYRGYGRSTGKPALAAMLGDVEPILTATGAPPGRTFVYGRSLGSIYAIEAARRRPTLGGLVIESGIADVLERVLLRASPEELGTTRARMEAEAAASFDHQAKLRGYPGPVLVLHGARDVTVPPSHAERNASWAARSELVLLPGCSHNTILQFKLREIVTRVQRLVFAA